MEKIRRNEMEKSCQVCGSSHWAKGLCRRHYNQRPEVKAYWKAYNQRPEIKARMKAYQKAYREGPEVKARKKAYDQRPKIPVIDCFVKDQPATLEELCARSRRGSKSVLRTLREWQKLNLVLKLKENVFQLNPDSPFYNVFGHYSES